MIKTIHAPEKLGNQEFPPYNIYSNIRDQIYK